MKRRTRGAALAATFAAALAPGLAGCGESMQRSLGLGKRTPDETRVVEQAPLELPPDFALRPPAPGAPRPQERAAPERAAAIVLGPAGGDAVEPGGTPGETAFLGHAGAHEADPAIRAILNREAAVFAPEDPDFVDSLMFWQSPESQDAAIDPAAEAERLRENREAGRPPTAGETPIVVRRERAPLEGLNPF